MTKNEIIKAIDDICEGLRRSTREANEALSRIRGAVGKVADDENIKKKLDLMLEEKKEEGKRECFELMEKLAEMPSEKRLFYFDYESMKYIIRNFTLEGIENGIKEWESDMKSETKFKRGDIVDIIDRSNSSIVAEEVLFVCVQDDYWVVVPIDKTLLLRYEINKYMLIYTDKIKESED